MIKNAGPRLQDGIRKRPGEYGYEFAAYCHGAVALNLDPLSHKECVRLMRVAIAAIAREQLSAILCS